MTAKKKIISVQADRMSPYDFETSLKSLKLLVEKWIEQFGENARLDFDKNGSDPYSDSPEYTLLVEREETDAEFDTRVLLENQATLRQVEYDMKEFTRLQKKLGIK